MREKSKASASAKSGNPYPVQPLDFTSAAAALCPSTRVSGAPDGLLKALLEIATQATLALDGEGRIMLVNATFETMFGYSREEILGRPVEILLPERNRKEHVGHRREWALQPRNRPMGLGMELAAMRKSGEEFPVEISLSHVPRQDGTLAVAFVTDITDRKRNEAALRESNDRFRHMADHAPVMIWVSGPDKLCTFFNKRWLDFVGRTMEQELGNGWTEGVHPDDLDRCIETYSRAFDERRSFQMEYRLRRADGEYRWLLDNGVPRLSEGGAFTGYIGSCIDITDMKETREQVFRAQKLESLGVLAGGIAHDFNNLLGSVLVEAESILSELPHGSPGHDEAWHIRSVAIRAAEIVRQLMAYAGKETAAFDAVDLNRLIGEMLELLKVSISKNAHLTTRLAEKLPAVRANAAQLQQVVMNLLTNASEALGEKGGAITITTSLVQIAETPAEDREADLSAGDYIRLDVSDNGCGMPRHVQNRIFDPFFTTKFAGRGLGLAAVQGIMRNHGGAIRLVSSLGKGTCFTIFLPCIPPAAAPPPRIAAPTPAAATVTGSVLVVEDENALRLSVSKLLRRRGFEVIEAADGEAALDLFRAHPNRIDVVLLDMTLPGLSGRELLTEFRRLKPGVKIILTTAYSEAEISATLGKHPSSNFIRKPYKSDDLTNLIRKVLAS